jgi:hypothetical protein
MTELVDLVEAYKREVAVPGTFVTAFPSTTDAHIAASLGDAFGEAQLDGFFHTMTLDVDAGEITPDLSTAGAALVVIYAGMRLIRQRILTLSTESSYKAGPVEYAIKQSAAAMTELLKALTARKNQILDNARRGNGTSVFVLDAYVTRMYDHNFYGGFFPYENALPRWVL